MWKIRKLIRMVVDFGEFGKKVVFSGIRKYYQPEELLNKKTLFVMNMVPKKLWGRIRSNDFWGIDCR